jgi:hypothetical protein
MTRKPDFEDICGQLAVGIVVPLTAAQWDKIAAQFSVLDNIATGMSGMILLIKRPVPGKKKQAWAIVEEPEPKVRVIRPLGTEKEARALIADRLAAYERMWDG